MTSVTKPIALSWKFPGVGGIRTKGGVLTAWPAGLGSEPTQSQVDAWEVEYAEHLAGEPMLELRRQRDAKLNSTDWRASSDLILTDAWKNYRQALRDLPSTSPSPTLDSNGVLGNVTWPTAP
tara:strand:- start:251 stop:616 length:366 start_codon:yes stop_codon:yes gene_type:complete